MRGNKGQLPVWQVIGTQWMFMEWMRVWQRSSVFHLSTVKFFLCLSTPSPCPDWGPIRLLASCRVLLSWLFSFLYLQHLSFHHLFLHNEVSSALLARDLLFFLLVSDQHLLLPDWDDGITLLSAPFHPSHLWFLSLPHSASNLWLSPLYFTSDLCLISLYFHSPCYSFCQAFICSSWVSCSSF